MSSILRRAKDRQAPVFRLEDETFRTDNKSTTTTLMAICQKSASQASLFQLDHRLRLQAVRDGRRLHQQTSKDLDLSLHPGKTKERSELPSRMRMSSIRTRHRRTIRTSTNAYAGLSVHQPRGSERKKGQVAVLGKSMTTTTKSKAVLADGQPNKIVLSCKPSKIKPRR